MVLLMRLRKMVLSCLSWTSELSALILNSGPFAATVMMITDWAIHECVACPLTRRTFAVAPDAS
jgi:hypothetical protein